MGTQKINPEDRITFEIVDRQVTVLNECWVYLWFEKTTGKVTRVGATRLHPAARAEKHLQENDPGQVSVYAFRVPPEMDRAMIRDEFINLLKDKNRYSGAREPEIAVINAAEKQWAAAKILALTIE